MRAEKVARLVCLVGLVGSAARLVWACSSFSDASNDTVDSGGPDVVAVPDGSTADVVDAAIVDPTDAADADAAVPVDSLLTNGGFESAPAATCAPGWQLNTGSALNTTVAKRSGTYGCLLCSPTAPASYGRLYSYPLLPNPEAGTYLLTAFVHQAPDGGPDSGAVVEYLGLVAQLADGGKVDTQAVFNGPQPAGFTPRSVSLSVPSGASSLEARLEFLGDTNGGCLIYDDVTLTRTP